MSPRILSQWDNVKRMHRFVSDFGKWRLGKVPMLVGMSMRMKMSLKSKCEDESLSSEQLEISPKSDLPESSSVLGSLQTVSLTKTCQIRTRIKKKRPLDTRKSFLNLACEYVFQTFAHQPVFLITRRQDRATILLEFRELVEMHKIRRSIWMRFHISSWYESKACCVNILLLFSASIRCKRRTLFRWSMDKSMSAIFQLTWP